MTDASGTFNTTVRDAAWRRTEQRGVQLMNWFSVACELHRDWRNDVEGLGRLLRITCLRIKSDDELCGTFE